MKILKFIYDFFWQYLILPYLIFGLFVYDDRSWNDETKIKDLGTYLLEFIMPLIIALLYSHFVLK